MRHDIPVDTTLGVESSTVLTVGQWYLDSRSAHRDAHVIEAYRQLEAETDQIFMSLARGASGSAVRVVFTRCAEPYESDDELIFAVRTNGTLEVTSAATAGERLHPLFDCAFGGAFDRFRAVHDLIADAAGCTVPAGPTEIPSDLPYPRNLTVVDAHRASASDGNLSLDAAYRMCRPEDSPEPLSLADAEQLAS